MARFIRYTTAANKTEYDISFDVTDDKGLEVWLDRNELSEGLDYRIIGSIAELRAGTGKIQLTSQPAVAKSLVIISNTEEKRVTNFAQAARFEEAEIDAEFNNFLRMLEDAILSLQSTPYFHPADIGIVNGRLPRIEPNGVIQVNAAGDGFEIVDLSKVPSFTDLVKRAEDAAQAAEQSEQAAKASETASEQNRQAAATSEQNAKQSETVASQKAQEAGQAQSGAAASANGAIAAKNKAEEWTVGPNPQPPQDQPSATNNTYYYFVETGKNKTEATAKAGESAASANLSKLWAVGPAVQPPLDQPSAQNNSLFWANESNRHKNASAASEAAAKASEQSAAADAQVARTGKEWAVGPSGAGGNTPSDTNNAYYWAQEAQKAAGGGVSSVNGDTGTVIVSELRDGANTRAEAHNAGLNIKRNDSNNEVQVNITNAQFGARLSLDANGRYRILQATKDGAVEQAWLVANRAGSVELNYNNVKRFETTGSGTLTTGNHAVDGQQISLLNNQNTGAFLEIKSSNAQINKGIRLYQSPNKNGYLQATDGVGAQITNFLAWNNAGALTLYHNNNEKLITASYGITVNGQGLFNKNGTNVVLRGVGTGNATTPSMQFQDGSGGVMGYVGYGTASNSDLYMQNAKGSIRITAPAFIYIDSPKSASPQGADANALTRRDFVEQELAKKATVKSGTADPVADGNTQEGDIYIKILP
ncbi:hypothetical protein [Vibrio phage CKB-S2]|nr:hypothetical protein [Vibrio phage CKB-S2]